MIFRFPERKSALQEEWFEDPGAFLMQFKSVIILFLYTVLCCFNAVSMLFCAAFVLKMDLLGVGPPTEVSGEAVRTLTPLLKH